jgi:hypothetical protein
LGAIIATLGHEQSFETAIQKLFLRQVRSPEAVNQLRELRPAALISTSPFREHEPGIIAAARNLGIPVLALVTAWDNITTKGRIMFPCEGYLVWSEQMKRDLHQFYPKSRQVPVYIIGAPQFDVFFQDRFCQTREEFCATQGLRPDIPTIVYALGSPNLLREHHGALYLARRIVNGDLGDVQLLVRPHPLFDEGKEASEFASFGPRVVVQQPSETDSSTMKRFQDKYHIAEWVNTLRYADVVVNLSSTFTVDAAIFDRPVVNLDFDPEPGQPNQALVKDINHLWTHFKPIAESGGVQLVNNLQEVVEAVRTYLQQPDLHREQRRWIAEYVCGYLDGRSGERMAHATLDFIRRYEREGRYVGNHHKATAAVDRSPASS